MAAGVRAVVAAALGPSQLLSTLGGCSRRRQMMSSPRRRTTSRCRDGCRTGAERGSYLACSPRRRSRAAAAAAVIVAGLGDDVDCVEDAGAGDRRRGRSDCSGPTCQAGEQARGSVADPDTGCAVGARSRSSIRQSRRLGGIYRAAAMGRSVVVEWARCRRARARSDHGGSQRWRDPSWRGEAVELGPAGLNSQYFRLRKRGWCEGACADVAGAAKLRLHLERPW